MIRPYKLKTLAKWVNLKLSPCYYGPYKIVEKAGSVAKLHLPERTEVRLVLHVSLLKKAVVAIVTG